MATRRADEPAGTRSSRPGHTERQRNCGAVPIGDQVEIRIKDGSAYYCGLETCGNVWLCPVCSAKIHHRRAAELRETLATWNQPGSVRQSRHHYCPA